MTPAKQTLPRVLNTLSRETVVQLLAYVQARRARDEVIQGLLQSRLAFLSSDTPATSTGHDKLLTAEQAAARLQVNVSRIYELVRAGKLAKVAGLGKQVRIPSSALTAQKRSNTVDSDPVL
jgi:excisionase family DNA binding protein